MHIEAAVISDIKLSDKYPLTRTIYFTDRKYQVIVASHQQFAVGDEVLFIPGDTRLPEFLLKEFKFWDYKNDCGLLKGKDLDIICPYYFSGDQNYFSYGTIVKVKDITLPDGSVVNIHDPDLEDKLGITYLSHKTPYYFSGDFFFWDVSINRQEIPDLECTYTNFLYEPEVVAEALIPGRRFYITYDRHTRDHNALGNNHNIYVSAPFYNKYCFLSNTRKNMRCNLFIKLLNTYNIAEQLEAYFSNNTTITKLTMECTFNTTLFGANRPGMVPVKDCLYINDLFLEAVPYGRYYTLKERNAFCKHLGLLYPPELFVGTFDYDKLTSLAETRKNGLCVRTPDTHKRALLYTKQQRLNRILRLH